MIEKLRKDDFIHMIWDGGPGNVFWLAERFDQFFLFSIKQGVQFVYDHFAKRDMLQVDDLRRPFIMFGFREYPVFSPLRNMSGDLEKYLRGEVDAHEKRLEDLRKEQEKKKKEEKDQKDGTKPELKIQK